MEEVARTGPVLRQRLKATNADATAKALACFTRIYWIAGGTPKAGGIAAARAILPADRAAPI